MVRRSWQYRLLRKRTKGPAGLLQYLGLTHASRTLLLEQFVIVKTCEIFRTDSNAEPWGLGRFPRGRGSKVGF